MANDWIKMRINLAADPAVIGIAARTKLDRFSVVGRLHTFWAWADEQSDTGVIPYVSGDFIDDMMKKKGFTQALMDVGWLVVDDQGVSIPNFDRHNGESAKKRAMDSERKRRTRLGQDTDNARTKHGQNADKLRRNAGPEKRREEKNREEQDSGSATALPSSPEEVISFFTDQGASPSWAEDFYDHFQSNGWRVSGKTPMKDWHAAARKWIRNNRARSGDFAEGSGARKKTSFGGAAGDAQSQATWFDPSNPNIPTTGERTEDEA